MEAISYDFCLWLSKNKLTQITITPAQAIEIDFKPQVSAQKKSTPSKIESQK